MKVEKIGRIIIAGMLGAIMLITSAGCSKTGSNDPSATTGTQQATTAAPTTEAKPKDGPMDKYADPVELTVSNVSSAAWQYIEGDSADDNIHTRMNRDYLNINYKSKWVVDETKLDEKINLAIASNDLPDVLNVRVTQLQSVIKNGQVQDLTDVWANYPIDSLRKNAEYQNKVAFKPSTKDGKIYGIPMTGDFGESVPVMYIRKDWLDNSGLQAPKTIDELVAVAKAFVENDPDKNGKKDTIAIAMDQLFGRTTLDSIAAAFNAYKGKWIKDSSGKLQYGSTQPEMKTALLKMQELYKMGAFDIEFAVKDVSKMNESLISGKAGIYFGIYSGAIDPLLQSKMKEPDVDWVVLPIPTATGTETIPPALPFAERWIVVRDGYEHPEAVIKSMNLWYSMNNEKGEPNDKWREANNGPYQGKLAQIYAKPYYFMSVDGNLTLSKDLLNAKETGDESKLSVGETDILNLIKKGDALGWAFAKVFYESEVVVGNYKSLRYSEYLGAPTDTMLSKGPSLDKIEADTFTKIIMGAPESEFDAFVEKWRKLGGDQITEEINASMN